MSGKTPGQLACEAFWVVVRSRDGLRNDPADAWPWAAHQDACEAWEAAAKAAIEAAPDWPRCPEGCGCRLGTEDADARECGCDGPCTGEDEPAIATAGTDHIARQLLDDRDPHGPRWQRVADMTAEGR